jgi:hypothetical protein
MYDMEPDQERLAGCYDGMRAGKALTISEVRLELARFGLTLDKEFQVNEAAGRISLRPEPEPKPDNPLGNPDYEEGYQKGIALGRKHARIRIRQALALFDLFLCEDGAVTSLEFTSNLVRFARYEGNEDQVAPLRDDRALHAFLDGEFPRPSAQDSARVATLAHSPSPLPDLDPPAPHDLAPSLASPRTSSTVRARLHRGFAMVKENVNRRTLIATFLGAITTSFITLSLPRNQQEGAKPNQGSEQPSLLPTQSQGSYVPPTTWDHFDAAFKESMLRLDKMFWTYEQSPAGVGVLRNIVATAMTAPVHLDSFKDEVVFMLKTSGRDEYWEQVCLALDPANCSPDTSLGMLRLMAGRIHGSRPSSIPPQVYQQLLTRYVNCSDEEQRLATILSHILTLGGIPH